MTNAEARFNKSLRPRKSEGSLGRTARDGRLDFHTAPKLRASVPTRGLQVHRVPQVPQCKSVKVEDREADDLFSDQLELTCCGPASLPGPTDALTARLRITEASGATWTEGQSGAVWTEGQSGAVWTEGHSGAVRTEGQSGAVWTECHSGAVWTV